MNQESSTFPPNEITNRTLSQHSKSPLSSPRGFNSFHNSTQDNNTSYSEAESPRNLVVNNHPFGTELESQSYQVIRLAYQAKTKEAQELYQKLKQELSRNLYGIEPARIYTELARFCCFLHLNQGAEEWCRNALCAFGTVNVKDYILDWADVLNLFGDALTRIGTESDHKEHSFDDAEKVLDIGCDLLMEYNPEDGEEEKRRIQALGWNYLNKAQLYFFCARHLSRPDYYPTAQDYYDKAFAEFKRVRNERHLVLYYDRLIDYHIARNDYSSAKAAIDEALEEITHLPNNWFLKGKILVQKHRVDSLLPGNENLSSSLLAGLKIIIEDLPKESSWYIKHQEMFCVRL